MIKKKDYELIAEAYERILEKKGCTCKCKACKDGDCKKCDCKKCECKGCECSKKKSLNECWSDMQQDKYDTLIKDGYKEISKDESNKTITLKKGLDGNARTIIIGKDGKEKIEYSTLKKESKDSIASHATFDPQQLIVNASRSSDPFHHGALAGYNYKIKQKGEGIIPSNTNKDGAAQEWQRGFDSIRVEDDKIGKKKVEDGDVHTDPTHGTPTYKKDTVKESVEKPYKVGDHIILNHPNYPGMKNKKFTVQQVEGDKVDLIGLDNQGYPEPRRGVFWVDDKYVTKVPVKESVEALDEKKKMACGKGCTCGKCPKCMPKKKKKSLQEALEEAYEQVLVHNK